VTIDPERIPVVIASGQSIEHHDPVTPVDLMTRACEAALADVPAVRGSIDRLSVVNTMTPSGPAPAGELAERLGLGLASLETTTIGGNTPQWLVSRAASAIATGSLGATVITGAEALRSYRARRGAGTEEPAGGGAMPPDPVVGDQLAGSGPAESAVGLFLPVHIYPMFESAIAARAGHSAAAHRQVIGDLFAPFSDVAAENPYAWFRQPLSAEAIATPAEENRLASDPYTKRMTAFLGSDQGAAVVVCSLAVARRAGVADRAVFIWSGSETTDVRFPTARPHPDRSPGIRAAGEGVLEAAGIAGGRRAVDIDDIDVLDLYSCFPSAVEIAMEALGIESGDRRALTATGGLPYFGGPGNNYTTHAIAEVTNALRAEGGGAAGRLAMANGLGWYVTKHAIGIYGSTPPPAGFQRADTRVAQTRIDDSAIEVALEVDAAIEATIVAVTIIRDRSGLPSGAPAIVSLPDGRHMASPRPTTGPRRPWTDSTSPISWGPRLRCSREHRATVWPTADCRRESHVRTAPRTPGSRRDPHHQPSGGPQCRQRGCGQGVRGRL
jgi:acetyl-CoA C-acetyltransferase